MRTGSRQLRPCATRTATTRRPSPSRRRRRPVAAASPKDRWARARSVRSRFGTRARVAALLIGVGPAAASSLSFTANEARAYEFGRQLAIPAAFGSGEFTLELWIRPTPGPIGPTPDGSVAQRTHWPTADRAPYGSPDWWYEGNFLLDGHSNATFTDGTFSLQMYGAGRLRWLLGRLSAPRRTVLVVRPN